jgi:hypothetical protein
MSILGQPGSGGAKIRTDFLTSTHPPLAVSAIYLLIVPSLYYTPVLSAYWCLDLF